MKKQLQYSKLETPGRRSLQWRFILCFIGLLLLSSTAFAQTGLNVTISGPGQVCPGQRYTFTAQVASATGLYPCGRDSFLYYWTVKRSDGVVIMNSNPNTPVGTNLFTVSGNTFTPTFPMVQTNYTIDLLVPKTCYAHHQGNAPTRYITATLVTPAPLVGPQLLCAGGTYTYTADGSYGDFNCNFHHSIESVGPAGWTFTTGTPTGGGWTLKVPANALRGTYEIKYRGKPGGLAVGGHPAGATPWRTFKVFVGTPTVYVTTSDDRTPQSSGYQYHTATAEQFQNISPNAYCWYYEDSNGNPTSLISTGLTLRQLPIAPCARVFYQLRVTLNTACAGTAVYRGVAYNTTCGTSSFVASPNPATDELTVKQENVNATSVQEIDLKLLNQEGKVVVSKRSKAVKTILDIKHLRSGLYYLTITNKAGKKEHKQIIVK